MRYRCSGKQNNLLLTKKTNKRNKTATFVYIFSRRIVYNNIRITLRYCSVHTPKNVFYGEKEEKTQEGNGLVIKIFSTRFYLSIHDAWKGRDNERKPQKDPRIADGFCTDTPVQFQRKLHVSLCRGRRHSN